MTTPDIHKKLIKGFLSLTFRKMFLDLINFVTIYIVVAKHVSVETFGIFAIASIILGIFSYFSDIGFGAAIIQKKVLDENDVKTTFFIQEILSILIFIIVWFSAPLFANFYNFDDASMWLIRALAGAFLINSFKIIPNNLLERELNFYPIVWTEVVEQIVFSGVLLYLVFNNYGITGFVWAAIAKSVAGVITIYLIAPWKIRLGYSKVSAKTLVNFGLPFQMNSLLALFKDQLVPLFNARIIGADGMAYATWAQGIASRPLQIMTIVIRVTFPAFARLQDEREELKKVVERSLFLTVLLLYPFLFGILAVAPSFVDYLGRDKWEPALLLIYLYALNTFWAAPSTIFTNLLSAVGKIGITLKLMVMWTVLTWILSPLLAYIYGYTGIALASAIISFTSIIPIVIVNKRLGINIINSMWQPTLASLLMGIITFILAQLFVRDLFSLIMVIGAGGIIYLLLVMLFAKNKALAALRRFKEERV